MTLPEIQVKVKAYREWLSHILNSINASQTLTGSIVTKNLDHTTYTLLDETVTTIKQKLIDIQNQLNILADEIPTINVFEDPNFNNLYGWTVQSTTTITESVDLISTTDIAELNALTGQDFSQLVGITNKYVITGLPNDPTDNTLANIHYRTTYYYPKYSYTINAFVKINGGSWQYLPKELIPESPIDQSIFQLNLGSISTVEIIYPQVYLNSYFGG